MRADQRLTRAGMKVSGSDQHQCGQICQSALKLDEGFELGLGKALLPLANDMLDRFALQKCE